MGAATPSVTVSSNDNPATVGDTVTYSALVAGPANGATPTGTVTFSDGGTAIGTCTTVTLDGTGTGTCALTYANAGSHTITAAFTSADSNYTDQATSNALDETVGAATPSVTVSSNDNPATVGDTVTYSALVAGPANGATPTGTVTFSDGGTAIGTCTTVTLDGTGTGTSALTYANAGSHTITAAFTSADSNYTDQATSNALDETVGAATPSVTVSSNDNPATVGDTVTYSALVAGPANGATPTGTVTFSDGGTAIGTCTTVTLDGTGTGTSALTYANAGSHTITAAFTSADSNYTDQATSNALDETVGAATPSVTVSSNDNPATVGDTVTYSALVAGPANGATPTGTVTFSDGGTAIGTCTTVTLDGTGTGTSALTYANAGSHTITAAFTSADSNYTDQATSNALDETVGAATPSVTVSSNDNPATVGDTVTYSALVAGPANGATPTGTVTFSDGGTAIGTCTTVTLDGTGTGTCALTYANAGSHTITAAFTSADSNYTDQATSNALDETVGAATPSVTVSSNDNPATVGDTVTYSALVAGPANGATPTGTVTFSDGGTAIGTCTTVTLDGTGTGTSALTYANAGSHTITAAFTSADSNYTDQATSNALDETVGAATPSVTVSSNDNPATVGDTVTYSALVAGPANGATPTGTVTFSDGGTAIGTCTTVTLDGTGTGTSALTYANAGSHTITAAFTSADSNYTDQATSNALDETVGAATPSVTVSSNDNPATVGDTVTYSALVAGPANGATPTGTVTFSDGGTAIGTCTTVTLDGTGTGTSALTYANAGSHTITAAFTSADSNYTDQATSNALDETVGAATPSVTVSSNDNPATVGDTVTYSALVAGPANGATPTGTVTFSDGGTAIGTCTTVTLDGTGTGTSALTYANAGSHTITAAFTSADSNYTDQATSNALDETVGAATPSVTVSSNDNPATVGDTVTYSALVAGPANGATPTGTVTFSDGGTAIGTCTTVTLDGTGTGTSALTYANAGSHTITAAFTSADSNYTDQATSNALDETVGAATPSVTVSSNDNPATVGDTVTYSALVAGPANGATPTGTVTFSDGGTAIGTCTTVTLDGTGTGTSALTYANAGSHTITAAFTSADSNYTDQATSNALDETVGAATPSVTVSSNDNPATVGDTVTYSALVAGPANGATPTGTVTFSDGGTAIGTCTTVTLDGTGTGTSALTYANAGSHTITAAFTSADSNYTDQATSNALDETVGAATPSVTVSSNDNPATVGDTVTYSALVAGPANGATPTGTVTFSDGGTAIGTCTTVTLDGTGTGTSALTYANAGSHTITAAFTSADSNYTDQATSNALDETVGAATPSVTVSSNDNPATVGDTVTYSALVAGPANGATPTGTVTFSDGGTAIGTCTTVTLDGTGTGTSTLTYANAGSHTITAAFTSADSNYTDQATSNALDETVGAATPSVTVSSNDNPATVGDTVTYSALVAGPANGATPTGTVTFSDGGTAIGTCTTVTLDGTGTGTSALTYANAGSHTITAAFTSADSNYTDQATSNALDETVGAATPSVTVSSNDNPATVGDTVTYSALVAGPANGATPTGTVTFSDGGTAIGTCTTVTLDGTGTGTSALTYANAGSHTITAAFTSADSNYTDQATSNALDETVGAATPSVTTSPASGTTATGSTLDGTVKAGGTSTTVTFCYSTSSTLTNCSGATSVAGSTSPVTGNADTAESATIGGLAPNTTYYFQIKAASGAGTTYGSVLSFTTSTEAPSATTSPASGTTAAGSTLDGTVNAGGHLDDGHLLLLHLEHADQLLGCGPRWPGPPPTVTGNTDTAESATIGGLAPNTTYYFQIKAACGCRHHLRLGAQLHDQPRPRRPRPSAATGVSASGATLNGSVNANGTSTTVGFCYSTSSSLANCLGVSVTTVLATPATATGTSPTAESTVLSGLAPNTTYYFQIEGSSSGGTTYGSVLSFTTSAGAPTATTNAASGVSASGATLNGSVNANGTSTTVGFCYSTSSSLANCLGVSVTTVLATPATATGTSPTAESTVLSGLAPNTTYYFQIEGSSSGGTTYGSVLSFTTSAGAPTATTNAASGVSASGATLNGSVNANGTSTTVGFCYSTSSSLANCLGVSVTTVLATPATATGTSPTAESTVLSGLAPNTTYYFQIEGSSSGGTTYGSVLSFTTSAGAPTATTNAASGVSASGATLNGSVNANGTSTTVGFCYSTSSSLANCLGVSVTTVLATPATATGTSPTAESTVLSGLAPNTTYYFQIEGSSSGGTTYGSVLSFTTSAGAPTATTNAASGVSASGATLNGSVNANGTSTTVGFCYSTSSSLANCLGVSVTTVLATPATATGTSATAESTVLSGLAPNTTYYFQIEGSSSGGTTYGSVLSFTTSAGAPTATTNAASGVSASGATLNGSVNANGTSTTVSFCYSTSSSLANCSGGTVTTVAATPATATGTSATAESTVLSGLAPNTTYYFQIKAVSGGVSIYGSRLSFTTSAGAPTATTNAASGVSASGATLNGSVNANGTSTTVSFCYSTSSSLANCSGGTVTTVAATPATATGTSATAESTVLSGLAPNTTYYFQIKAVSGGVSIYGSRLSFTTSAGAPTATTNAASGVSASGATLNGSVNANGTSTTVSFCYSTSSSLANCSGGTVTTVAATPATATGTSATAESTVLSGLAPNTTYYFQIKAVSGGVSIYGSRLSFTTSAGAPTATTNAASGVSASGATLNGSVNANGTSTTVSFCYSTSSSLANCSGGTVTTVAATPATATGTSATAESTVLSGLAPNTTYYFQIKAVSGGVSIYGSRLSFTTSAGAPTATTNAASGVSASGATLNGSVNANGTSTTVSFCYSTSSSLANCSGGTVTTVAATPATATGTSATAESTVLSGLAPNTTYYFQIKAVSGGVSIYGSRLSFTTSAGAPTATTNAASGVSASGATLNGSVNANGTSTTVSFCYSTSSSLANCSGGTVTTVAATPATATGTSATAESTVLSGLAPNTTYYFQIKAVSGGVSIYGSRLSFTTSAGAPTATTNAASGVSASGATLNGSVNANGTSTTVSFCYSTSSSLANCSGGTVTTVAATPATATGTSATAESTVLSGLAPNTTYYFQIKAVSGGGTTYGSVLSFTTSRPRR